MVPTKKGMSPHDSKGHCSSTTESKLILKKKPSCAVSLLICKQWSRLYSNYRSMDYIVLNVDGCYICI